MKFATPRYVAMGRIIGIGTPASTQIAIWTAWLLRSYSGLFRINLQQDEALIFFFLSIFIDIYLQHLQITADHTSKRSVHPTWKQSSLMGLRLQEIIMTNQFHGQWVGHDMLEMASDALEELANTFAFQSRFWPKNPFSKAKINLVSSYYCQTSIYKH